MDFGDGLPRATAVQARPYAAHPAALTQEAAFVPYNVSLSGTATWHGFMLEGPGYTVEFVE